MKTKAREEHFLICIYGPGDRREVIVPRLHRLHYVNDVFDKLRDMLRQSRRLYLMRDGHVSRRERGRMEVKNDPVPEGL
jgi:hypothetical protein